MFVVLPALESLLCHYYLSFGLNNIYYISQLHAQQEYSTIMGFSFLSVVMLKQTNFLANLA